MKTRFLAKLFIISIIFSTILFLFAGRLNYFQGWIFLGTNILTGIMNYLSVRNDNELMKERSKIGEGTKSWDKLILLLSSAIYLIFLVISGLDSGRFHWSPPFHWSLYLAGIVLTITGQSVFLLAKRENAFFSAVVRIQVDRGHKVCDTGIYKIIRHPGYLGMIISIAAMPLLTGSLWGFIPVVLGVILLFIRTYLEDKTLLNELSGYIDYSKKTQKRLIPGIW